VRNSWGTRAVVLWRRDRDSPAELQAASWIQLDVAKRLVGLVGLDLDKMFEREQMKRFQAAAIAGPAESSRGEPSLKDRLIPRMYWRCLPGTDAGLGKQAVLYTAQLRSPGDRSEPAGRQDLQRRERQCDGLRHPAGAGARVGRHAIAAPRSILFASVTAEEQGLLGSEYFGETFAGAAGKIMVDLNFDDVPPLGTPEEVEVSGAERTTFYPLVEATAADFHLAIRPVPRPEAGHYYPFGSIQSGESGRAGVFDQ